MSEQKTSQVEAVNIKSYVSLAPTNLAALIIDGIIIHKFACLIKSFEMLKNMKFKYIFLDEVSMLQERFYKILLTIKKFKPETNLLYQGTITNLSP